MIETRGAKVYYVFNYILITLVVLTMILPLLNIIATSFSSERAIVSGEVYLWPVEFSTNTYKTVFTGSNIMRAMGNTVELTLVGVAINIVMTVCAAYPLSKKRLHGRTFLLVAITFTMLVGAGIVPNFMLIRNLGLMNTYWALWLPGALSTYNMIVMKTFFSALPDSLEESAVIDGANDLVVLFKIVLPLSMASIATITLFYAVGYWNSYFGPTIYISSTSKKVLQQALRDLINSSAGADSMLNQVQDTLDQGHVASLEAIKAAAIIVATLPIMVVYPFLQKYFVKGVMIGSIKG